MKIKITFFILIAISFSSFSQSLSPTVVASGGKFHSAGGYTLSATVGELAVTTLKSATLTLTQGFQQPFAISVNPGFDDLGIDWSVNLYPNPVSDFLNIRFNIEKPADFNVEIMDISGRKHMIRELYYVTPGEVVTFDMSQFIRGIYMVRIFTPDQRVQKVHKIQKF